MKTKTFIQTALLAALICLPLASCKSDGPEQEDKPVEKPAILTEEEQKVKLETAARELTNRIDVDEVNAVTDLLVYAIDHYIIPEDYDINALTNGFNNAIFKSEEMDGDKLNYYIKLPYFGGKYAAREDHWEWVDESHKLELSFPDEKGAPCLLTVDATDEHTVYNNGFIVNGTKARIGIPQKLDILLTQGSKTLALVTANPVVKNGDGSTAIFANDISGKAIVKLPSYNITAAKSDIEGKPGCRVDVAIEQGTTKVVTAQLISQKELFTKSTTADPSTLKEENTSALTANNPADVEIDVLGKVQAKGIVTDLKTFAEGLKAMKLQKDNESNFKIILKQVNSLLDVGIFYDGDDTRMAKLILIADVERNPATGTEIWKAQPAVSFSDGTSYLMKEFFSETNISDLIKAFKEAGKRFRNIGGE